MKVDRLVSIIMILLEKERISAQELADMFEISPRTVYRDIDAINLAGIPIRSTSGVGGGFEIMEIYKMDKKVFSTTDLSAILMGLSNLSNMIHGNELVNALAKVRSFIPADKARDIEVSANQIYIDLNPWINNRTVQPYLEIIKTALAEHKLLSFDYIDRQGQRISRIAEPYQLVLKGNSWYWQGYCLIRKDFRLFKLTRTSNLKMKEEIFTPREHQNPQLEFNDTLKTMQTTIRLRIHKSILDNLLDYCAYERFTPDGENYYLVDFPFIENDYFYDQLLSFGNKCECLEPFHVREELKRKVQELLLVYEK